MVNEEIVDYLKKGVKRGFPILELKQNLLSRGYSDFDVGEAIKEYNLQKKKLAPPPQRNLSFFTPKFVLYSAISIFIFFTIVTIALVYNSNATISIGEDFEEGQSVDLMQNKIKLDVDGKRKILHVSSEEDSISVDLGEREESIQVGEEKILDLNNDGVFDLVMRLDSFDEDGIPRVYFRKLVVIQENSTNEENLGNISSNSCQPVWTCVPWTNCSSQGIQTRNCIDRNNCGIETDMPVVSRSCEVGSITCVENWTCSDWQNCSSDSVQERECEDLNDCGTTSDRPGLRRSCEYNGVVNEVIPSTPEEACIAENSDSHYYNLSNESLYCSSGWPEPIFTIEFGGETISCCRGGIVSSPEEVCELDNRFYINETSYCDSNIIYNEDYEELEIDCCPVEPVEKFYLSGEFKELWNSTESLGYCNESYSDSIRNCVSNKCSYYHPFGGIYDQGVLGSNQETCHIYLENYAGTYEYCRIPFDFLNQYADYYSQFNESHYSGELGFNISYDSGSTEPQNAKEEAYSLGYCQFIF